MSCVLGRNGTIRVSYATTASFTLALPYDAVTAAL